MSDTSLQQELSALKDERGWTWDEIARSIGRSGSTIKQWVKSQYPGDNAGVEEKVAAFIALERERNPADDRLRFVQTTVARKVREICRLVHRGGEMGLCVGPSGVGKTIGVRQYAQENPGVIVLEAHLTYSTAEVFRDLHRILGFSGKGTIHRMLCEIRDELKGTRRMIVIDEAEHMSVKTLDELRRLNDWTGVGVLYVGLEKFRHMLRSQRGDYGYIVNRIRTATELRRLQLKDTAAIIEEYMPESVALAAVFHECCGGVTRTLSHLIHHVQRTDDQDGRGVDAALIRQVASELKV